MQTGGYTDIKTITRVERSGMSKYGNPIHEVYFDDATSAKTEVDGQVNYMITNSDVRGVPVEVTFSRAGRVRFVKLT